jgi:hypothetical protein
MTVGRVAGELGFRTGTADALKRCRPMDGGWERCELPVRADIGAITTASR